MEIYCFYNSIRCDTEEMERTTKKKKLGERQNNNNNRLKVNNNGKSNGSLKSLNKN